MRIADQLIHKCVKKERAAQRQLYDQLMPYMVSICRRYVFNMSDVQDAVQETFINIFSGIEKYDQAKGSFKTWAVRVAINASFKLNKRMDETRTVEFVSDYHEKPVDPSILTQLEDEDLLAFFKTMPQSYFDVFNLHVIDGYSHKEIAELLKIDESLSRQRLTRARKWLAEKSETSMPAQRVKRS